MSCGTVCPKFPSTASKSDWIYEATCYFEKWFASKAKQVSLKVYDARNTLMYLTVPLGYCSEYMLSLNIGLTGLSEITRMSEIWRLYPTSNRVCHDVRILRGNPQYFRYICCHCPIVITYLIGQIGKYRSQYINLYLETISVVWWPFGVTRSRTRQNFELVVLMDWYKISGSRFPK